MTTGNTSLGSWDLTGPFALKAWSGDDYPSSPRPRVRAPKTPLVDMHGRPLDLSTCTKEDLTRAHIRRKAAAIRAGTVKAPKRDRLEDHSYSCIWRKGFNAPCTNQNSHAVYPFEWLFGSPVDPEEDPWNSNDDIALINKLRSKILGSDFNLGVFLAESNQSLQMIAQSATKLARAYGRAKKGNFRGAFDVLYSGVKNAPSTRKGLANNWLELQYGWKPLLNDIDDGARFLAHQQYAAAERSFRVSRQKDIGPPASSSPSLYSVDGYGYTRKSIIARVRKVDLPKLSGLTDVRSILWEKVPYSFIVDWVIPIGNYLATLNTVSALDASYVVSKTTRAYGKPRSDTIFSGDSWVGCGSYWREFGSFSRTIHSNLDVPLPSIKRAKKIASVGHALNALALLSQRFK